MNYEPTVLPVAVGGYYWVVFTSRRAYGNFIWQGTGSVTPACSFPSYGTWRASHPFAKAAPACSRYSGGVPRELSPVAGAKSTHSIFEEGPRHQSSTAMALVILWYA